MHATYDPTDTASSGRHDRYQSIPTVTQCRSKLRCETERNPALTTSGRWTWSAPMRLWDASMSCSILGVNSSIIFLLRAGAVGSARPGVVRRSAGPCGGRSRRGRRPCGSCRPCGGCRSDPDWRHPIRMMLLPRVAPPARSAMAVSTSASSYSAVMSMSTLPFPTSSSAWRALSASRSGWVWLSRLLL